MGGRLEEMGGGVIVGRFGDEESRLLDQYERLSFEIQLNQAILRRSLSEPSTCTSTTLGRRPQAAATLAAAPPPPAAEATASFVLNPIMKQGGVTGTGTGTGAGASRSHKSRFHKFLKMLIKPILGSNKDDVADIKPRHKKKLWKAFSRSLRV